MKLGRASFRQASESDRAFDSESQIDVCILSDIDCSTDRHPLLSIE